jgi:hypothetical protein
MRRYRLRQPTEMALDRSGRFAGASAKRQAQRFCHVNRQSIVHVRGLLRGVPDYAKVTGK